MRARGWVSNFYNGLESIWVANPIGYLKIQAINKKDALLKILHDNYDLVGFTDGSWSMGQNQILEAGQGGILYDKPNHSIFLFSGPIQASTPLEAEFLACRFLIEEVKKSNFAGSKIIICTDSYWLAEEFSAIKIKDQTWTNFYIMQCDREINLESDFLAKNGAKQHSLLSEWISN